MLFLPKKTTKLPIFAYLSALKTAFFSNFAAVKGLNGLNSHKH